MLKPLVLSGLLLAVIRFSTTEEFPEAEISNNIVKAKLYLPDQQKGYYRGQRFDWSGVIASLEYKGHTYFGCWFDKYDPYNHDAISGPVEEFVPIGYETAKPGEPFLKIGVGALIKKEDTPYAFYKPYENINPGTWTTEVKKDKAIFTHVLTHAAGYSYTYEKIVRLKKNHLILEHHLKNTGTKTIETNAYDHNFFVFDNQPIGPGVQVTFPFELQAINQGKGFESLAEVKGKQVRYLKELEKGESAQVFLAGFGTSASDYNLRAENKTIGIQVHADQPITRIVYWSIRTVFSPEPYIKIKAEPGKTMTWKIEYEFFVK
ncbi:MAG: hypothetical protein QM669_07060 [Siphonobacter sp.]